MWKKVIFLIISIVIIATCVGLIMKNNKEKIEGSKNENNIERTSLSIKY